MKNKRSIKDLLKGSSVTYGMVILAYVLVEIALKTGNMSSLMQGLLVPLCIYSILAVSLNLVVGISGELSLGHAGFMCVGAFTGAVFSKMYSRADCCSRTSVFVSAFGRDCMRRYLRNFDWNSGASASGRLSGDCNTGIW